MITTQFASSSPSRQAIGLLGWVALCFVAATTAFFVSADAWYTTLNKPSWNPPAWVFGPVWSLLYTLMAVAAWLVWRKGGWTAHGKILGVFLLQWFLNVLWTPLFFGLNWPGLAFAEIILLWIAIAVTSILFWRVSKVAGFLLIPYLAWVTYAAVLNYTIWRLNV
jgi:tryptophan-rich sensory protein